MWFFWFSAFQGHPSIDVSNQYFTLRKHALQDRQVSFSPVIDPDNILSEVMGEEFVHTEDNEVEYYEACKEWRRTKWVTDNWDNCRILKIDMQTLQYQPWCHTYWWHCGSPDFIWRHTVEREQKQDGDHTKGDNSFRQKSAQHKHICFTNGSPY